MILCVPLQRAESTAGIAVIGRKTRLVARLCFAVAAGGHSFAALSAPTGVHDDPPASEINSSGQPKDASARFKSGKNDKGADSNAPRTLETQQCYALGTDFEFVAQRYKEQ